MMRAMSSRDVPHGLLRSEARSNQTQESAPDSNDAVRANNNAQLHLDPNPDTREIRSPRGSRALGL